MARARLRVGSRAKIKITLKDQDNDILDISSATSMSIILADPDGNTSTKEASFATDMSDGVIEYDLLESDLDQSGDWEIQARIVVGGETWNSTVTKVNVYSNL